MNLNEYFDKIYCINLDRRVDRWDEVKLIFENHGITVERFSACDGKEKFKFPKREPGGPNSSAELGGTVSHRDVILKAKEENLKNVLIFEDDVDLLDNMQERFNQIKHQIPNNWDMIYFGGNHVGGITQMTENVFKANRSYALQMYAVNNKAYDILIKYCSDKIDSVISGKQKLEPSVAADYFIADLHKILNIYVIRPHFSWQRKSFSDLAENVVYYDFLKK